MLKKFEYAQNKFWVSRWTRHQCRFLSIFTAFQIINYLYYSTAWILNFIIMHLIHQVFRMKYNNNIITNTNIKIWLSTNIVPKDVYDVMEQKLLVMAKVGDYKCTICNVPIHGPEDIIIQHFGGKKHCKYVSIKLITYTLLII